MCRHLFWTVIVLIGLSTFAALPAHAWVASDPPPAPQVPPPLPPPPIPTPQPAPEPVPPPPTHCHDMPEPSSLVLGLIAAGTLGFGYLRRR
jgi:hypothetical protein